MVEKVYFSDALKNLITFMKDHPEFEKLNSIVVRDVYGKLRVAIDSTAADVDFLNTELQAAKVFLGRYGDYKGPAVLCRDDFFDSSLLFSDPDIVKYYQSKFDNPIRLLDRQVTGQDWIRPATEDKNHPTRIAFYGLKGGVGRSTAISLYAYHLGKKGKKVLLVDLDLESPGLSSLMLPTERQPDFGIVDWFVEDAIGQSDDLVKNMTALSPLSLMPGVSGRIYVASAVASEETSYLSKLSRVLVDVPQPGGGVERFHERAARLLKNLEMHIAPDVVLIDSRAGLHDIAAVSIVGLADRVLLFGTDSPQTWQGYNLLFSHWQTRPQVLDKIRDRLKMVDALFPESSQELRTRSFVDHAYTLFYSTIYEEIPAGESTSISEAFNFDQRDSDAPHFPLRFLWNQRFQEFSESLVREGTISEELIAANYSAFFRGIDELYSGEAT